MDVQTISLIVTKHKLVDMSAGLSHNIGDMASIDSRQCCGRADLASALRVDTDIDMRMYDGLADG